jgi:hypothetical protein
MASDSVVSSKPNVHLEKRSPQSTIQFTLKTEDAISKLVKTTTASSDDLHGVLSSVFFNEGYVGMVGHQNGYGHFELKRFTRYARSCHIARACQTSASPPECL